MNTSRAVSVAILSVALAVGVGAWPATVQAQVDTAVRVSDNAVVDISVRSGRLLVRGVSGTTGSVRGEHRRYELRATGTTMTVQPREDANRRSGRDDERLEVDVPRGVRLVVRSLSGDVEVHDIDGSVDIRTASGNVRLGEVRGRVDIESMTGDIAVTGPATTLRISTMSGDLRLREMRGELDVRTTSGDVSISGDQISRLTVESISGDVGMDGVLTRDARARIATHSGDVSLRLPEQALGMLEISTINGDVHATVPLTLLPGDVNPSRAGRHTRRYQLGNGGPLQVDISTFSGDIRLVRAPQR